MKNYKQFIFEDYAFDQEHKTLELHYSLDSDVHFTETFTFPFEFTSELDKACLDRAFQALFFMAGVSYYKTYLPAEIVVRKGSLTPSAAEFFSKTYRRGLGEFFFVNKLDPNLPITFPVNTSASPNLTETPVRNGKLVAIGGGKDSLVSVELLRGQNIATWSVDHKEQLEPLVKRIGLPHYWVEREWDKSLLEINKDAYNGHVPVSAILACTGVIVAVLAGFRDVVMSNEASANEPNLTYRGVAINHQYSKSLEFEADFQAYIQGNITPSFRYYSLLRPFSEVRIAELFSRNSLETYQDVFSSCNRAFRHGQHQMTWCGECPKCAFIFLAFTPFVSREKLETLFHGKNLLLDPALEPTYRQLLGIEGDKPLECVGEVKESRSAMNLAKAIYPELNKYAFELDENYDFRTAYPHHIPADVLPIVEPHLH